MSGAGAASGGSGSASGGSGSASGGRGPAARGGGRAAARIAVWAAVADAVAVVVFAAIGRASHGEDWLAGLGTTAWPFLVGAAVGWAASLGWRAPLAPWRTGLPVWAGALGVGMLLRLVSGQGVQFAFVVVAGVFLLLFLVGWRLVAAGVRRWRARRAVG